MRTSCLVFLTLLFLQGCIPRNQSFNQFSSTQDTLVIRTEKLKGTKPFSFGAGPLHFGVPVDSLEYPADLSNIELAQMSVDFKAELPDHINIIKGLKQGKEVFVVDENNNSSFIDDSIRSLKAIDWYSSKNAIKYNYIISNGKKIVNDSSWVKLGASYGSIFYGRDEHLVGKFHLDTSNYEVAISDQMSVMSFTYDRSSEIAITSNNGVLKDSLMTRDLFKMGEYINLSGQYYQFDNITNNGEYITLIKENNFENKVGTQIGMIAPNFIGVTIANDTIKKTDFDDKPLVVANSCGCGGDVDSTEAFFDIKNTYGDKLHVLRLDSGIEEGLDGIHIDMKKDFNKDFYHQYRNVYCSRIAYVIKDGRIIEKFQIIDWKSFLPEIIDSEQPNNQ